jgi:hypothetical protein
MEDERRGLDCLLGSVRFGSVQGSCAVLTTKEDSIGLDQCAALVDDDVELCERIERRRDVKRREES